MTEVCLRRRWSGTAVAVLWVVTLLVGCQSGKRVDPVSIANTAFGPMTIAVAPALNLSGSRDFDANRFADLMASELGHADGISVIPVSRTLSVLASQGVGTVESPTRALELATLLGADAILVFSVSEYDPYEPPCIGIAAQLFGTRPGSGGGTLDPVALSRQARLATSQGSPSRQRVLAQTQRVFDASHRSIIAELREFAERRGADESPYGWRKYVVSQQEFIRFCCHATIRALLEVQSEHVFVGSQ